MGLTNREILYVVELVYYAIALPLSLFLVFKHGFSRQIGWFYLVLLGLLRLIGAGTGIGAANDPTSQSLLEASVICTSIGISPLLLALLGILERVNNRMNGYGVSKNLGRIIHIPIVVGLILAIISGTKQFSDDQSTINESQHFLEAAAMLYLAGFLGLVFICVTLLARKQSIVPGESRLVYVGLLSLPFIAVRIIYTIITAFDHNSSTFSIVSTTNTSVIVQAIMSVLMEFIVVAIYILAGFAVAKVPRGVAQNVNASALGGYKEDNRTLQNPTTNVSGGYHQPYHGPQA